MKITQKVSLIFYLFLFLGMGDTYAQLKIPRLVVCEDCLQEVLGTTFQANNKTLIPFAKDSLGFELSLESPQIDKALLYLGDSEYIQVIHGKDTLWAGKFMPQKSLKSVFARYLIPVKLQQGINTFQVKMWQNDGIAFSVKPIMILGTDISEAIPLFYAKNEPARMVNLITCLLITLLLIYALYQTFILKNNLYQAYGFYLISILFFLFIFSDEYLQWHLLLPNNIDK